MPLPVRLTDCGELFALLLTVSVPPLVPRPVGENRIVSEHLSLGPIVAPQPQPSQSLQQWRLFEQFEQWQRQQQLRREGFF